MTDTKEPEILAHQHGAVATLTLNRPHALNALSHNMVHEISRYITAWENDGSVAVVVLRGAGLKAFCAGGDIRAMRECYLAGGLKPQAHIDFFIDEYRLDYRLQLYKKPIIALLDGIVMGGGMGLVQGAPFRLVGPKTKMAMPETAIGLFPDVGGSKFMSHTPTGLFLALTGQVIGAADAIHANFASYYLEPEALNQFISALELHHFNDDHFDAIAQILMPFVSTAPPSSIMPKDAPIEGLARYEEAIDRHFSFDKSLNEIIDSLQREKDETLVDWAELQLKILAKRSPTSLCVTHAGVLRGRQLSLAECFRMELGIVTESFAAGDVIEGIRALAVDKDHHPKWNPATLQEVDEAAIAKYFINTYPSDQHPLGDLETRFGE